MKSLFSAQSICSQQLLVQKKIQCKKHYAFEGNLQNVARNKCGSTVTAEGRKHKLLLRAKDTEQKQEAQIQQEGGIRQLLGVKDASATAEKWKLQLQLTKPVTWPPLLLGTIAGAAASGSFEWSFESCLKTLGCAVLAGPFLTGYTQTLNDYYDKDIDAINEPYRPIPSGAVTEQEAVTQIFVLLFGGLGLAYGLDQWAHHDIPIIFLTSIFGSFIAYIYSAPPLKLKTNGFYGNYALGSSYIALPWWCGQEMFSGTLDARVILLTLVYSIAGFGIAIVNDFKSVEGDQQSGLKTIQVMYGVEKAKYICVGTIDLTQILIASYLYFGLHKPVYAAVLLGFLVPQVIAQVKFLLPDPVKNDVKYQGLAQPFLVFGIIDTALAIGRSVQ